jgi:ferredoxin-NADP reductase/anaerobic selenocysteine-containing dehydrogenase
MSDKEQIPTIEHAGMLEDMLHMPAYLRSDQAEGERHNGIYSCAFCGVGDSGKLLPKTADVVKEGTETQQGEGVFKTNFKGQTREFEASFDGSRILVKTKNPLTKPGSMLRGELQIGSSVKPITAREVGREFAEDGGIEAQRFQLYKSAATVSDSVIKQTKPTTGCVKLKLSLTRQRPAFPIQVAPSYLEQGQRQVIDYQTAIKRFADLLLEHRGAKARSLIYACGQIDYFTIFAMQEVFRLLGIRNITGNAEHCLNAGAVHNEKLTGQEGPFLTVEQGTDGPNRFYIFNGWNGFITHPPVFSAISKRKDLDAYLIEVMVSESAKVLASKLGPERILLVKPGSDPHFALAVAHEILVNSPKAIEQRFIKQFSDKDSFKRFVELARSDQFAPQQVAERIAPEPQYVVRLVYGIKDIAKKLAKAETVPINIPSVGLSQTSGIVTHCLWGNVLAMLGKYGLKPDGSPAGGTLRVPGQINAQTEIQGMSRKYFFGRVPIDKAPEVAQRMGLPEDAYASVLEDTPRTALDYSDPTPGTRELFISFGAQFEANMMERDRWLRKLKDSDTQLVVIDPIPDPFSVEQADLIIPSPPHPATTKIYQNGEWKMSLSVPQKKAPPETRSDVTIIYDVMAEITRRLETDEAVAAAHPDLARHAKSGYLSQRFGEGLKRIEGEVSRSQLWQRILDYMNGGSGPLYCAPEHPDGLPIQWDELLEQGSIIYGGVGTHRYTLDYDRPDYSPFGDIFRQPRKFEFFTPTEVDLNFPDGVILNSGRSGLLDNRERIRFATSSFNSGKATPAVNMPDENPLHISPSLAKRHRVKTGDFMRITGRHTGNSLVLPIIVTNRVKGDSTYVSFHKSRAQIEKNHYVNIVSSHEGRCPYCAQTSVKATQVLLERLDAPKAEERPREATIMLQQTEESLPPPTEPVDTTLIDTKADLPLWQGQATQLYVTDIIEETHDVYTFRFQGNPLCKFVYWAGQFCTLVLNINGKKVLRSYTISSTPSRPYVLEITVKRVPGGLVSNWLPDNLKVGEKISIAGPKGKFCLVPGKIPKKILFLTGGSGVTPLMSMSRWLCDVSANVDIKFLNSVRSPNDIIFRKELELLTTRYKMFEPVVVSSTRSSSSDWMGLKGRINRQVIESVAPDFQERHVFMCGPPPFMEAMKGILMELGFNMANFHTESFGGIRTAKDKPAPTRPTAVPTTPPPAAVQKPPPPTVEEAPAKSLTIEFVRSGKKVTTDGKMPLLDLAEENDVDLDYGCRSGDCGDCKARLLKGKVEMECEDGLEDDEKAEGYILTCVGTPVTDCELEI